jgi:hypothetical protein
MSPKIFGREPAALLAMLAIMVKLFAAFVVDVTADQQAVINAVLAASVGIAVAVIVHDGMAAALYGFAQAAVALAVGFGLHWDAGIQALVLSGVATALGWWTRTQVTAPVAPAPLVAPPTAPSGA